MALCPTELIKIRMQDSIDIECKKQGPSLSKMLSKIWKTNGFIRLFHGLGLTMTKEIIGCPLFLNSYERGCKLPTPIDKRIVDCDHVEFSKPIVQKNLLENQNSSSIRSRNHLFSLCDFLSGWIAGWLL